MPPQPRSHHHAPRPEQYRVPLKLERSARKVWLVKVPKWIAQKWSDAKEDEELGRMSLTTTAEGRHDIQINLPNVEENADIPKQLKLNLTNTQATNMFIFSDTKRGYADAIEGVIQYEAALTPVVNDEYRRINRGRSARAAQPTKQTQIIEREELARRQGIGIGYSSTDNIFAKKYLKQKTPDTRRERIPKQELIEQLITLFRQHRYWNMKGLKERTEQPEAYLREILGSVAIMNKRGPYAGMWSIRPELKDSTDENVTVDGDEPAPPPPLQRNAGGGDFGSTPTSSPAGDSPNGFS